MPPMIAHARTCSSSASDGTIGGNWLPGRFRSVSCDMSRSRSGWFEGSWMDCPKRRAVVCTGSFSLRRVGSFVKEIGAPRKACVQVVRIVRGPLETVAIKIGRDPAATGTRLGE